MKYFINKIGKIVQITISEEINHRKGSYEKGKETKST